VKYTEILIRKGVISPDQLAEAQQMVAELGIGLADAPDAARLCYR